MGKVKCSALAGFTFCPGTTSMTLNDSAHVSQTDSSAFEFSVTMQALEDTKEFVHAIHIKAHTVVAHKVNDFAILDGRSDFDRRRVARTGVFDRVRNQVQKDLKQQTVIALHN